MGLIYFVLLTFLHGDVNKSKLSAYDRLVLTGRPIAFWADASGKDLTKNHKDGVLENGPWATPMPNGDPAFKFNGINQFMELANDPAFSIPTSKILSIEAWIRPDSLDFPRTEGSGYVYWLGKGAAGHYEYAARIYGQHPTGHDSNRPNRISGYVFNTAGGLGAGSYYQAPANFPVKKGEWLHFVLIINTSASGISSKYPTGYTKLYLIRQNNIGSLTINTDQDALAQYNIIPAAGPAPLRIGTRDLHSFFKGAIGKIAIYNYELDEREIVKHALNMFPLK